MLRQGSFARLVFYTWDEDKHERLFQLDVLFLQRFSDQTSKGSVALPSRMGELSASAASYPIGLSRPGYVSVIKSCNTISTRLTGGVGVLPQRCEWHPQVQYECG